ncbi:DUF4258 domain-containing protein [Nocardioides sp. GY 10127]|nr:DUF4258 domain-containing protein [Nocardioides sp. GY 10127]
MNLVLRGHPLQRMAQRGITRADIENALANSHTTWTDPSKPSVTYIGPGLNGQDLKVWTVPPGVEDPSGRVIIKSAAWKD